MVRTIAIVFLAFVLAACSSTKEVKPLYSNKVSKQKEVEARVQIALLYMEGDNNAEAISELERAMAIDPKSPRVHEVLALVLERVGELARAEKHFKTMVRYDGKYSRGRANYGYFLMRQEKFSAAYKQLEVAASDIYYPRRAEAYQQMGVCAERMGREEEMLKNYQKAISIDRNFAPPLLDLAKIEFEKGNFPQAQSYFDSYRKKTTQTSAEGLLLGVRLARVFEDKNAEASYAMALKNLYPRSQEYLDYLELRKQQD